MSKETVYVTKNGKSIFGYEADKYKKIKADLDKSGYRLANKAEVDAYLAARGYKPEQKQEPKKKEEPVVKTPAAEPDNK